MQTLYKVTQLFGNQIAIFRVPTTLRGDAYLSVSRSNYQNDVRSVVEVDAARFLDLWRQPYSSHEDVAQGSPDTWPQDYKFHHAEEGFAEGESNPVPLAEISCFQQVIEQPVWQRHFWLFRKLLRVDTIRFPTLSFTNGVTRTIWLLTAGATVFPVEVQQRDAALLQEMAGVAGGSVKTVEQLVPPFDWSSAFPASKTTHGKHA